MPRSLNTTRAGLRIEVDTDGLDLTKEQFAAARREMNARVKDGLGSAARTIALPEAKRLAPHHTGRLASSLTAKSTARAAYLTTALRGKKGRYVGLMEFGGTVRGTILPKGKKQALKINGRFVAKVTTPRHYKGKHFMERAVTGRRKQIDAAIQREVMRAFDGFNVT